MSVHEVIGQLERIRIVPVVVLDDASRARDLGEALIAGGIPCAEIALRTGAGLAAIERAAALPGFLVGAGTVLTPAQLDRAVDAGAAFVVTPGLDEEVVSRARDRNIPIIPGVATATEVQHALALGLDHLKFFPAAAMGGLETIDALHGPFPHLRFLPSGGVSIHNARAYLSSAAVFAVSGSWMVPREAIAIGRFDEIERLSREAASGVFG